MKVQTTKCYYQISEHSIHPLMPNTTSQNKDTQRESTMDEIRLRDKEKK